MFTLPVQCIACVREAQRRSPAPELAPGHGAEWAGAAPSGLKRSKLWQMHHMLKAIMEPSDPHGLPWLCPVTVAWAPAPSSPVQHGALAAHTRTSRLASRRMRSAPQFPPPSACGSAHGLRACRGPQLAGPVDLPHAVDLPLPPRRLAVRPACPLRGHLRSLSEQGHLELPCSRGHSVRRAASTEGGKEEEVAARAPPNAHVTASCSGGQTCL